MLPDLNNEALKCYGIPELIQFTPELFNWPEYQAKPILAVLDQGVDPNSNTYTVWKNPGEIPGNNIDDDGNGYIDDAFGISTTTHDHQFEPGGSHGRGVANSMVAACPGLISVMNIQVAADSTKNMAALNRIVEGLVYAAKHGALAANISFGINDVAWYEQYLRKALILMIEHDCIYLANYAKNPSYPAAWRNEFSNVLTSVALSLDYSLAGSGNPEHCQVAVYASAPSWAAPVPGGLIAMMKALEPSLQHGDIIRIICGCAEHEGGSDRWCEFGIINHKRTIEFLLGRSVEAETVPVPEPAPEETPEPEQPTESEEETPDMIDKAENDLVRIECDSILVNGPNQERGNRREGLGNMLEDNSAKTLFWVPEVTLNITVLKPWVKLVGYRTANDFPSRDLSAIEVDGTSVGGIPQTPQRHIDIGIFETLLNEGEHTITLKNRGIPGAQNEMLQLEYLDIQEDVETPEPEEPVEEEPIPEPVTVVKVETRTFLSDGTIKTMETIL